MGGRELVHHALLIGIDCYIPHRLPHGESYHCLGGCVRDVELMEGLLRKLLGLPDERIVRLTASGGGLRPTEPPERWPTRENIIAAFDRLTATARPGDHVYIHYSGHGGRARTIYVDAKGPDGVDEGLVPTDIGTSPGGYLRDLEVAKLVGRMVDAGLVVAITLDCCHSGGMTRGAMRRGIAGIDERRCDRHNSLVTPVEAMATVSRKSRPTRSIDRVAGLLPDPVGYTLIAACLKTQSAHEVAFDGQVQGALTHWLLRLLPELGPHLTYKALCDAIATQLHAELPDQTPVVLGEVDRVVLGAERRRVRYAARILREDLQHGALLDVGRAHGVTRGARFAAYAGSDAGVEDLGERVAELVVREVSDVRSWADVVSRSPTTSVLEGGMPTVMVGPSSSRLVRKVAVIDGARIHLEAALAQAGWVAPAVEGETPELQVTLDDEGYYGILDAGGATIPWLRPAIHASQPMSAARVVARLEHLSRFRALMQLANHDVCSSLARCLQLELLGWAAEHDPSAPFEPMGGFTGPAVLEVGQWTALRIRNAAKVPIHACLIDLAPDWSASHVWPRDGSGFRTLDPGEHEIVALRASLPPDYDHGVDVLKVFATVEATDFRWLELPRIDEPTRPTTRHVVSPSMPGSAWTTAQLELTIRRVDLDP